MKRLVIAAAVAFTAARADVYYQVRGVQISEAQMREIYNKHATEYCMDSGRVYRCGTQGYCWLNGTVARVQRDLVVMRERGGSEFGLRVPGAEPGVNVSDDFGYVGPGCVVSTVDAKSFGGTVKLIPVFRPVSMITLPAFAGLVRSGVVPVDLTPYAPQPRPTPPPVKPLPRRWR